LKNSNKVIKNTVKSMICRHNELAIEMGYKAEGDSNYCLKRHEMAEFVCTSVCSSKFVPCGETIEGKTFKPSFDKPVLKCEV
jgi:hypothetical protein